VRRVWYSDNRDLVKWSVLFRLAERFGAFLILQIAYYRSSDFESVIIDGKKETIPQEVLEHFRCVQNIKNIKSDRKIFVFDSLIKNRAAYLKEAISFIRNHHNGPRIVFLDPDTGLEPIHTPPNKGHVLESEALAFWDALEIGDTFVFYQHQTNRKGQPWIETKRVQLAEAIKIRENQLKVADGLKIAHDVVFFYARKA
jgi:hypothetical protein